MTIRHLKIMIAVADCGKMSLAAKQLYISQPTVSQAISEIEESYGVCLFERLSKKLYITPAGEQLLLYARHIVSMFDEMEKSLRNSSDFIDLRMGATITVGSCVLAGIINQFEKNYPYVQIKVIVDNTHVIEQMLLNSALDIALVEGKIKSDELICTPVIKDELVLICSKQHPFAGKDFVTAAELENEPFILREKGSGTRAKFEEYMLSRGISVYPKWTCHSADAILSAVIENQGVSVISRMLVQKQVQKGELCIIPIRDAAFQRFFSLVYHKNKFITEPLKALINEIAENSYSGS